MYPMQFCYIYEKGAADQLLLALFLRIYEDAGVHTLPVECGSVEEQRCTQFLGGKKARFPFVMRIEGKTRRVLTPAEYTEWIHHLVENGVKNIPSDSLQSFCHGCATHAFVGNSSALAVLQLGLSLPLPTQAAAPSDSHTACDAVAGTLPSDTPPLDSTDEAEGQDLRVWAHPTMAAARGPQSKGAKLGRISVTEAMQNGRERETRLGACNLTRQGTTTR